MQVLEQNPPVYLVDREYEPTAAPAWAAPLAALRDRRYRHQATFGGFRLYRRLGSTPAR